MTLDTMRLFGCFKCCNRADDDHDDESYYESYESYYEMTDGMIENWTIDDYLWLGTYIGDSESVQTIHIDCFPREREEIDALMGGFSRNRSIQNIEINTDLSNHAFAELGRVMRNMENIQTIEFYSHPNRRSNTIGPECADSIASVIGQCKHVNNLVFERCTFRFSGVFAKIAVAMNSKPQLEQLSLYGSNIGRDGCAALGTTLESLETRSLTKLDLSNCAIDDDGLQTLVAGIAHCNPLHLRLSGNYISAAGLGYLSVYLESESCCLEELILHGVISGDDEAEALADGLKSNESVKHLRFWFDRDITAVGKSAFSRLLCDTSSINNTYSSNHTLEVIGDGSMDWFVDWNITLNRSHQQYAAKYKILLHHPDIQLQSFFQWDLKFLPLVADWFDTAMAINNSAMVMNDSLGYMQHWRYVFPREKLQQRKLAALYKYIRGVPPLEVSDDYIKAMQKSWAKRRMTKRFSINRLFIHSK